jgi:hypothetical protein
MLHKHHKISKHMGGSDDDSNIELLSRADHAEAHRKLFEQFGKREDYWAWKFLSRTKDWEWLKTNNPSHRPDVRKKISQSLKEHHQIHPESAQTRERKRQVKMGQKNPNFGKGFYSSANDKLPCKHCGLITTKGNLGRWHNSKCKSLSQEHNDVN